jgi:hypothetical protein
MVAMVMEASWFNRLQIALCCAMVRGGHSASFRAFKRPCPKNVVNFLLPGMSVGHPVGNQRLGSDLVGLRFVIPGTCAPSKNP